MSETNNQNDGPETPWERNRRQYESDKAAVLGVLHRGKDFKFTPEIAVSLVNHFYTIYEFQDRLLKLLSNIEMATDKPEEARLLFKGLISTHNESFVEVNKLLAEMATSAYPDDEPDDAA